MIAACLGLGLVVGGIGAFFGIGGGFLVTPFLHAVIGFSAPAAVATSTAQIVLMSASGSSHYLRQKLVHLHVAALLLGGSLPAAWCTAWLIGTVQTRPFGTAIVWGGMTAADLGLVMAYTLGIGGLGVYNLYRARPLSHPIAPPTTAPDVAGARHSVEVWLTGIMTGIVSVTLGIGGGFITFPVLVYRLRLPAAKAVATGMLVMWVTSSLATVRYGLSGTVFWLPALLIGGAGMVGAQIGARLAVAVSTRVVIRALGVLQATVALVYIGSKVWHL